MPVHLPLPPLPPIGEKFLPTLAPAASLSQFRHREFRQVEQSFQNLLSSGDPGSTLEALLRQAPDPLVVTSSPGADEAATNALRALRAMMSLIIMLTSCCFAIVVTFIAYQYRRHKAEKSAAKYESHEDFKDFKTGVFDCWDDLPLCCFVFQCPWIRWAENVSLVSNTSAEPGKVGILGFWIALSTFLMLTMLSNFGGGLVWAITACVLAFFRQKFRKAFGMKNNTGSFLHDCFLYLCCCYCLIAQDARHVDEAKRQEHPAIVAP
jgi:Cys-rich protein (TIGR01571 family)